jgi:hypothetical protein
MFRWGFRLLQHTQSVAFSERPAPPTCAQASEERPAAHRTRGAAPEGGSRVAPHEDFGQLAQREAQAWQEVETLIQRGPATAYDEAAWQLLKLRELAESQNTQPDFN